MLAKRLMTGAASRVINTALGIAIALWMTPFLIHHLGDEGYGLWIFVAAITGVYGVLDLGISVATQRAVAQALARNEVDDANATVVTAFAAFCGVSLLILLVTVVVAAAAPEILKNSARVSEFRVVIALLAASLMFLFPTYAVSGIYSANLRYDIVAAIHLNRVLLRCVLIYVVVNAGGRLISVAAITTVTDVAAGIAMVAVAQRLAPWLSWRARYFQRTRLRELFHFGGAFLVVTLCERGRNALPSFAVNATAGLTGVTLFGVAQQIYDYCIQFVTNIFGVFQPLFVRQQSAEAHDANQRDFLFVTQLALTVAVVIAVGVVSCGPDFIRVWLGPRFERSLGALYILVILGVFHVSMQATPQLLLAYSRQLQLAVLSVGEVLVSVLLLWPLSRYFQLEGVAAAVLVPALGSRAVLQPMLLRNIIGVDLGRYFRTVARACVALLLAVWMMTEIRAKVPGDGYSKVLLLGIVSLAITVPLAYVTCLDARSRRRVAEVSIGLFARPT